MPTFFATVLGALFWAAVLAVTVAAVRPRAGTDAAAVASAADRYSRRIGLAALVAAGWLQMLVPGLQSGGPGFPALWFNGHFSWNSSLLQLGVPVITALAILAVGEVTWPRPRGSVRSAGLRRRSAAGYVPRYMGVVFALLAAVDLVFLLLTAFLPPAGPKPLLLIGWGPWLVLTVIGTAALLKLIAVRGTVPGAAEDVDEALRRASAHRALRVGSLLCLLLLWNAGVFYSNYPWPAAETGVPVFSGVMAGLALILTPLAGILLLRRAPAVPLAGAGHGTGSGQAPGQPANGSAAQGFGPAEQTPTAVRAVQISLTTGVIGPALAYVAVIAVVALGPDRAASWAAVPGAAAGAYLAGWLTGALRLGRLAGAGHAAADPPAGTPAAGGAWAQGAGPGAGHRDPQAAERSFTAPPRWLSWITAAAGVAVLGLACAAVLLEPHVRAAREQYYSPLGRPGAIHGFQDPSATTILVLTVVLVPLLCLLCRRIEERRPILHDAPLTAARLRRVALSRLARTAAAANVGALGILLAMLGNQQESMYADDARLPPLLEWLDPLLQALGSGATVLFLVTLVIVFRPFGPSHFEGRPAAPAPPAGRPGAVP